MIKLTYLLSIRFYILLLALLLSSCAIEQSKNSNKDIFSREVSITVDSETQSEFDRALNLLKESEYDQAIILLNNVIEQEKRLAAPYINLAIAHSRLNQLDKSEQALIKAVAIENTHPIANNELALVYRKTGRFNDARVTYERILSVHPNYLPAIKNLGVLCEIYLHDLDCALSQFEEYQKYYPDDKTISIWVSDLRRRLEQ